MVTLALTLALAAADAAAAVPLPEAPPGTAQLLETPAQVRALCEALVLPERMRARGDAVQRARAVSEHERRRDAALHRRYQVGIPGERLRFTAYDAEEHRLGLSERAFLAAAGGSLHVWPVDEDRDLSVAVDPVAAQRVMQAAERRQLALVLTFNLPEDDDEVTCAHRAGAASWSLGVEPVAWAYVEDGVPLARGGEGADRPLVTAAQGARARVEVAEPMGEGGPGVRSALEARASELLACYGVALRARPGLDGSMVLDAELSGGAARTVRLAVDSLQDDGVAACAKNVVTTTRFPPVEGRIAIPIHFRLDAPGSAGGGTGSGSPR
ncbi:MAG TPA: hypothetical protein VFP65_21360 [Anaeromyxobacteraceae bacterium]|nr:hypothetical protein [Anaeromyxobacteraceae bacterium]